MEGRTQDLDEGSFPSTYVRKINVAAAAPKTVERCSFLFFSIPPAPSLLRRAAVG